MSVALVPVDTVLAPVQAWCRTTGFSMRKLGEVLGYSPSHFYRMMDMDQISRPIAEDILSHLTVIWPKNRARPKALKTWATAHPEKVLAVRRKLDAGKPILRKCLCCPSEFMSEGPHNRMCAACRCRIGGLPRQMVG